MPSEFLLRIPTKPVIDKAGKFVPVDLSVSNPEITKIASAGEFEAYLLHFRIQNSAAVLYGGYNEERDLYKRSGLFSDDGEDRNIHIGLDIWAEAGTTVYAPLDGTVHSFDYNAGLGNYGPTIILEHAFEGNRFYTLYGHLSMESIAELEIGDLFRAGRKLGTLGSATVNGDYAPHLHFQIILDIEDHFGDYPGVCTKTDREAFLKNCPDPNLLLKINQQL